MIGVLILAGIALIVTGSWLSAGLVAVSALAVYIILRVTP